MAWGWYLKILDSLHVWKISDDTKRSPIFVIHVANPIFSGFTLKKPSNICIIMSQNLTWINVWKVNTFVSQMIQNFCSKSNIVQTTCNSSNSTVQQIEQRSLWSQTTLATMKSEGNHQKCLFWLENTLEPNNKGNHNKWKELRKTFIFEQEALRSQTTLETITSEGNHPKWWFWAESTFEPNNTGNHKKGTTHLILSGKQVGAKLHCEP